MRFRLLQARTTDDPVRSEELTSFASRLGVPEDALLPYDVLTQPLEAAPVLDGVDAVLVGGSGAFSVYGAQPWGPGFIDLMGELAEAGTPVFASCFGFQALVMALGGEVRACEVGSEVGSFDIARQPDCDDDPLFQHLPASFVAQQGHKDRALDLPEAVLHLASSSRCPYQALRVRGRPVWATQFHPELTHDENRDRFMRYYDMYESAFGASQAQSILDHFRPSPEANGLLRRFAEWVAASSP